MEKFRGWVFPAGERHLQGWMKKVNDARNHGTDVRLLYQGSKYRKALTFVRPSRRSAIDIGAHIGLWSWQMRQDFNGTVHAFEPMPEHRACYEINMRNLMDKVDLVPCALGAVEGLAHIRTRTAGSSGDTGIDLTGKGLEVPIRRLDEFELNEIDFMKVDCEGFELFVLQGARETLLRNKPCVIVEQKPETGMEKNYSIGTTDAVKFLESLGAVQRAVMAGDYIMSWES